MARVHHFTRSLWLYDVLWILLLFVLMRLFASAAFYLFRLDLPLQPSCPPPDAHTAFYAQNAPSLFAHQNCFKTHSDTLPICQPVSKYLYTCVFSDAH